MKKHAAAIAALVLSAGFSVICLPKTAQAAVGWLKIGGEWSYLDGNNQPVTSTWKQSKDQWYYLSEEGVILKNSVLLYEGSRYYLDETGKVTKNKWVFVDENNGAGDEAEEGWYYFGADGKCCRRKNSGFKWGIDGNLYIFDENGKMLSGWFDKDGYPIGDSDNPFVEGVYYAKEDGRLLTGEWLNYGESKEGFWGSDLDSEIGGRNYTDYDELWMYFDTNSKKVASSDGNPKQKVIDGAEYGFDENGMMVSWWNQVASDSNANPNRPVSSVSARYFSGYDGGTLMKDCWLWMYPSENLDPVDYENQECSWWHTDKIGRVYRNTIKEINGRSYAFDGIGRMQTGFVLFDEKDAFVARYAVDDWSSEDFIEGNLYGIERADLYLFSPDELNDGSMLTGKNIAVRLDDGVFNFGFAANGKAYGNRNQVQKKNNMYYINGLRLEADADYKYGVVQVDDGEETYYQVVNTHGQVIGGTRKVLKDGDNGYLLIINDRFMGRCDDEDMPKWRTGDDGAGYYHYDKGADDPYSGGLITAPKMEPDVSGLLEAERLNF